MARQRRARPEYFVDDKLNTLAPIIRWVYLALRAHADKEGRLLDRPGMLRVQCIPHDNVLPAAFDEMLWHLHGTFITRYSVAGIDYIQLNGWNAKAECSAKEAASVLPAVSEGVIREHHPSTVPAPSQDGASTPVTVSVSVPVSVSGKRKKQTASPFAAAKAADEKRETYVQKAGATWGKAYGGIAPFGRIGHAFKPLVERERAPGETDTETYDAKIDGPWTVYCTETPAEFASPEKFVATYGHWKDGGPRRSPPKPATPITPKVDPAFLASVFRGGKA